MMSEGTAEEVVDVAEGMMNEGTEEAEDYMAKEGIRRR